MVQVGGELNESRKRMRKYVQNVIKRRMEKEVDETCAPPKKRRRTKSFVTVMMLDNMLRHASQRRLSDYIVEEGGAGKLCGDIWKMPCLSVATDSGPDCVRA